MTTEKTSPAWATWATIFLAGPVIWYLHFWLVYLLAEAGCSAGGFQVLGLPAVSVFTVVATIVAVAAIAVFTVIGRRRISKAQDDGTQQPMLLAGYLLGVCFIIATLFVGVPASFISPC
ncbi:MAG: hypothetical protein GEU79_06175 [Acidimicrobiia bacterium]|nr:hypothetical protein [Acidimicrobiia bacterium]